MSKLKDPESKFIKVRCQKCKNEQIVFGKSSTDVECLVCGRDLLKTEGGKSELTSRVLEVLD
ncbi:MAG: 30S ribosomal protein S27e [Candidatus Woesearchaeota archaeon]